MKPILEKLNKMIKKGKQFGKINKNMEKLIKIKKLIYTEIFDKIIKKNLN